MKCRVKRHTRIVLWALWLLSLPRSASADNCSALSDCYGQIAVAVVVAILIALAILLLLEVAAAAAVAEAAAVEAAAVEAAAAEAAAAEAAAAEAAAAEAAAVEAAAAEAEAVAAAERGFVTEEKLIEHFEKHVLEQGEFTYQTPEEYLEGARSLMKGGEGIETFVRSNGDKLFYNPATNEFGVLSQDGIIRTFFRPGPGLDYWLGQIGG